jgi:hypothetical protein
VLFGAYMSTILKQSTTHILMHHSNSSFTHIWHDGSSHRECIGLTIIPQGSSKEYHLKIAIVRYVADLTSTLSSCQPLINPSQNFVWKVSELILE